MRPIIGVIMRPERTTSGNDIYVVYKEINEAIIKSGGIVIGIPPYQVEDFYGKTIFDTKEITDLEFEYMKLMINRCDGVICQGGVDYFDYEAKVIKYCYENDKPLFGICLGMQAMSCVFNGGMGPILRNDLNHYQKNEPYAHIVKIDEWSKLYQILGVKEFSVNSRHKDCITKTSLEVVGCSEDEIIEAVEDDSKSFFIGVQWHPESMFEYDILAQKLFAHFVEVCRGK